VQIARYVRRGEVDSARAELRRGADPNAPVPGLEQTTLLGVAASSPRSGVEMIDLLLDHGAEIDRADGSLGHTPLHLAAKFGDLVKVRRLVERGASLHKKASAGYSAVLFSAFNRTGQAPEIARFLLRLGVDPHAASEYGESPLGVAAGFGDGELVGLFLDAGVDPVSIAWTPLHRAAALGDRAALAVANSSHLESRDRAGRTPLLVALQFGDAQAAQALRALGADLRVESRGSRNALMHAARSGAPSAVAWVLENAAPDLHVRDDLGLDALSNAVESAAVPCVAALLAAGADPSVHGPTGESPVHHLPVHYAPEASAQLAGLLLDAGADPAVIAPTGDHPLRDAAQFGCLDLLRLLLDHGVPPNLNSTGETALHVAVSVDDDEAVRLLLASGADPNQPDVDGDLPADFLRSEETAEALRALS